MHPAVHQDRWMPRKLQLLQPKQSLEQRDRDQSDQTHGHRRNLPSRREGEGGWKHEVLHGRRVERAVSSRERTVRKGAGNREESPSPGNGGVHHPWYAHPRASTATSIGRTHCLQSQPGHLARVLRESDHHKKVQRSTGNAQARTRGRHQHLFWGHHRLGRGRDRSHRTLPAAGDASRTPGVSTGELAGGCARHAFRGSQRAHRLRAGSLHSHGSHFDAQIHGEVECRKDEVGRLRPGHVLLGRGEFHFFGGRASHDQEQRRARRCHAVSAAWFGRTSRIPSVQRRWSQ
mmetsp:Transcript_2261/g.15038  ORF Transcript_2261/g.15038 Transcript_2261/m.15038 type:complete len:289 (-) Transcript_2261:2932-3798(-)